jgi:hypothetical protein
MGSVVVIPNHDTGSLMRIDESTGTVNTNLEKSAGKSRSKLHELMSKPINPNRSINQARKN